VLLLDEPFGALDAKVRKELRRWLRRLHDEMHVTSVFVTHDQDEAMEVADRIVVMNQGRIEQQGSPDEVYDHPASPFVLQFLGDVNLFHGRIGHRADAAGADVCYVRPHELEIVAESAEDTWPVTLAQTLTVGPNTRLEFARDGTDGTVDVELPRESFVAMRDQLALRPGSRVHLRPRRVTRFAAAALGAAALACGTSAVPSALDLASIAFDQRLLDHWAG
jgi:sulfate transport system ATP-binding protein